MKTHFQIFLVIWVCLLGTTHACRAQTLSSNLPSQDEIEQGIVGSLPRGAYVLKFEYEVFSDDERGVGRVSVAGTYSLDHDYYMISNYAHDEVLRRMPVEYYATEDMFYRYWDMAATTYGGHPKNFMVAQITWAAGTALEFSGNIRYLRGVDGFRFDQGGLNYLRPSGKADLGGAFLVSSDTFKSIESEFYAYLAGEAVVWDEDQEYVIAPGAIYLGRITAAGIVFDQPGGYCLYAISKDGKTGALYEPAGSEKVDPWGKVRARLPDGVDPETLFRVWAGAKCNG
jgi:hypothetical protein